MIVDLLNPPESTPTEADICIIGAGAAGLSLAHELSRTSGLKILLLESGSWLLESPTQELYSGKSLGSFFRRKKTPYLKSSRLRFFGGTTNHWTGWVFPFDELDFEERSWIPESGWPISRSALLPFYSRAQSLLGLHQLIQEKVPGDDGSAALVDPSGPFEERIFQIFPRRLGADLRSVLTAAPNLTILLHANVLSIDSDSQQNRISQVRVGSLSGKQCEIRAKVFVLACGGIENARLLLASKESSPKGLGNEHDLVGRFFADHPHVPAAFFAPSRPFAKRYRENYYDSFKYNLLSVLHPKAETLKKNSLPNFTIQLQETKKGALSPEIEKIGRALAQSDGRNDARDDNALYSVFLRSEQIPNANSRVLLDDSRDALGMPRAKLDWQVTSADLAAAIQAISLFSSEAGKAGSGRVLSRLDAKSWPPNARGGNHHLGTTRMHRSSEKGVVDENCRLHSRENFFIAGSSIFPTTSAMNPTLTIIALALRLADHLRQQLKVNA
jgi:choline dehydrogenase-like flavoprotein